MDSRRYMMISAMVLVAIGVVLCFAGYRLFHAVLPLVGFCLFFITAWSHLQAVGSPDPLSSFALSLIAGVAGAILLYAWFYVALFVLGAGLGSSIAYAIAPTAPQLL